MVDGIIDTSIVIDLMNGYPSALSWQQTQTTQTYALTTIIKLETLKGAVNKNQLLRTAQVLNKFPIIDTLQSDLDWAYQQFERLYLRYGVDWQDCIIAAPCQRLNLTLYTRNLKHYMPILGTLAQKPY